MRIEKFRSAKNFIFALPLSICHAVVPAITVCIKSVFRHSGWIIFPRAIKFPAQDYWQQIQNPIRWQITLTDKNL